MINNQLPSAWMRAGLSAPVLIFAVSFLVLLAGCANFQRSLDLAYRDAGLRNYDGALAELERSSLARSRNNRLLYLMEKGVLLHLARQYRQSNQVLEEADRLVEELHTRSLSAESLSFLSSDRIVPYAGEDHESLYINYYKTRNYLALGELEGALVEARRIDEKLNYLAGRRARRGHLMEGGFMRMLTGLIYESAGDWNNAFIAYRKSLEHYQEYNAERIPETLWDRLILAARQSGFLDEHRRFLAEAHAAGLDPRIEEAGVAILIDCGFVPIKREVFVVIPTEQGFPVKLALPEFQSRPAYSIRGRVEVSAADGEWVRAEPVEDMGAIARQSLEDRKKRVVAKMVSRAVAKEIAVRKTQRELGPGAGLLARVAGIASEQADVRSWTMLPERVLLAVIPVAPGQREVTIRKGNQAESRELIMGGEHLGFTVSRM